MNSYCLIAFFALLVTACSDDDKAAEQKPARSTPQYFYFPRANVYFDSANKEYLFLANDSSSWQTARQIPNVMQGLMDKSIHIKAPPQPVWKDNDKHKLIYSSLLYATAEDTVQKKEVPKPVAKAPVDTTATEKKDPKGFRKVIGKIFGIFKKDKKKKDTLR
jgi:hypothetical protein